MAAPENAEWGLRRTDMDKTTVQSSNLASVGYDPSVQTLEIQFNHGGIYQYHGVPEGIYIDLINAPSKGTFFAQRIRNSFSFIKVG